MQIVSIILILSILSLIGVTFFNKNKSIKKRAIYLTIPLSVILLILIGFRWQLIPILLSVLLGLCFYFFNRKNEKSNNNLFSRILKVGFYSVVCLISILPAIVFPYFQFDKPSGENEVGAKEEYFVDSSRQIKLKNNQKTNREIKVTLFYPAEVKSEPMLQVSQDMNKLSDSLSKAQGIPSIFTKHFNSIKTNAYVDAKVKGKKESYPLILFSHGMGSYNTQSTFQMAELASHGYVIASIEHPGDAAVSYTSSGELIPYANEKILGANKEDLSYLDEHNVEWVKDAKIVMNQLQKSNDTISSTINFDKIGYLGFSYGGATALQSLMTDSKIKAAVDLDGALFGSDVPDKGIEKPFLLINSSASIASMTPKKEQTKEEKEYFKELMRKNSLVKGNEVVHEIIPHSNHVSFTDLSASTKILNEKEGNAFKNYHIINQLTLKFFNQHLK